MFNLLFSCQSFVVDIKHHSVVTPLTSKPPVESKSVYLKSEFILAFVGDVIVHERIRTREERHHDGFRAIWSPIQNYLASADLTYANLEGPVAPEYGGVTGFPMFNYPKEIISELKQSGFDVVSTANNHALDRQARGIRKTIENLKKNKLGFTGTISSAEKLNSSDESWWHLSLVKNSEPNTKEDQRKYIAWVSCTEMTNGNRDKENQVLYCFKDIEKVKKIIETLSLQKFIVATILLPHWGEEDSFEIQSYRRRWAHIMINKGASAIVGSHPHVVQKIENYISENKRNAVIAYSLGNFLSNQQSNINKASMLLYLKLKEIPEEKNFEISDVKYIPLWMTRKIDKDGTAIFRQTAIWDLTKMPKDVVSVWKSELGEEKRLKNSSDVLTFLNQK